MTAWGAGNDYDDLFAGYADLDDDFEPDVDRDLLDPAKEG